MLRVLSIVALDYKNFSLRFDFLCAISINLLKSAQIFALVRIIAVMFTFSFGSAFAAQELNYEGQTASKVLLHEDAFTHGAANKGEYGITEAYRTVLVEKVEAYLDSTSTERITDGTAATDLVPAVDFTAQSLNLDDAYYTAEVAAAKAAMEKAIADIKAAKTADDADDVYTTLEKALLKLTKTYVNAKLVETGCGDAIYVELAKNLAGKTYFLPGYGYVAGADIDLTDSSSGDGTTGKAVSALAPIKNWFIDNGYRTNSTVDANMGKLVEKLELCDDAWLTAYEKEMTALQKEMNVYAKKYNETTPYLSTISTADLEGIEALLAKKADFESKYCWKTYKDKKIDGTTADSGKLAGLTATVAWETVNFAKAAGYAMGIYLNQSYADIKALPAAVAVTSADRDKILDLSAKVKGYKKAYPKTLKFTSAVVADEATLTAAYNAIKDADAADLDKAVKAFTPYKANGTKYYFDASEKNVTALADARKAYDEYAKNYGYGVSLEAKEAKILAGENNKDAAADYDVKDNSLVQAYLNNATVKVTTAALGNTKIRVQAKIDTVSFEKILDAMDEGCTVSYKFYHKTAKANAFKGPKEKDRNYITYTKLSLKKGVKYKFQCGVVIKDAQGNVVAEKSYKASTTGSRVCR